MAEEPAPAEPPPAVSAEDERRSKVLAEYRKQHGVEQGVEQPSADDEMPQAAG